MKGCYPLPRLDQLLLHEQFEPTAAQLGCTRLLGFLCRRLGRRLSLARCSLRRRPTTLHTGLHRLDVHAGPKPLVRFQRHPAPRLSRQRRRPTPHFTQPPHSSHSDGDQRLTSLSLHTAATATATNASLHSASTQLPQRRRPTPHFTQPPHSCHSDGDQRLHTAPTHSVTSLANLCSISGARNSRRASAARGGTHSSERLVRRSRQIVLEALSQPLWSCFHSSCMR
jgi:hypothetical protein